MFQEILKKFSAVGVSHPRLTRSRGVLPGGSRCGFTGAFGIFLARWRVRSASLGGGTPQPHAVLSPGGRDLEFGVWLLVF